MESESVGLFGEKNRRYVMERDVGSGQVDKLMDDGFRAGKMTKRLRGGFSSCPRNGAS